MARREGLAVSVGSGTAADLADHIAANWQGGKLACIRGVHAAMDLAAALAARQLPVSSFVLYDQKSLSLSREAWVALDTRTCIFPVYSARTASVLAREAAGFAGCPHLAVSISDRVARQLAPLEWRMTTVSGRPGGQTMMTEVLRVHDRVASQES